MDDRSNIGSNTEILHGKEPTDLPDLMLRPYDTGPHTVIGSRTGPHEGLTAVKRSRAHLSLGDDIDFIDTVEDSEEHKSVPKTETNFLLRYQQQFKQKPAANNNSQNKPDQNANKETASPTVNGIRPRKLSKSDTKHEEITKFHQLSTETKPAGKVNIIVRMISTTQATTDTTRLEVSRPTSDCYNKNIEIPKENISPNDNMTHTGKQQNLMTTSTIINCNDITSPDEYAGITNWKMECDDDAYGLSVSLYEKNFITQESTGNPIADCYGIVMRGNSTAMALADGVNWGKRITIIVLI